MLQFDILTIFPNIFDSYLKESILGRAQKQGLIKINTHDLRGWTEDKHHKVDDSPFGGGVGMVMMVEPIYRAIKSVAASRFSNPHPNPLPRKGEGTRIILLSPRGERFTQAKAKELTQYDQLVFVCGRYEGIDERVSEFIDEQISIGDYVLNGGEVPAMVIVEAVSRLKPGVLGKDHSSQEESWSDAETTEYPQYTRPETFKTEEGKELRVPEVLLSGNHQEINKWRQGQRRNP